MNRCFITITKVESSTRITEGTEALYNFVKFLEEMASPKEEMVLQRLPYKSLFPCEHRSMVT